MKFSKLAQVYDRIQQTSGEPRKSQLLAGLEPEMVLEVDFQDIQKTMAYESGYALRIPRFRRERTDKSTREADTLARLKRLYDQAH